MLKSQSQSELIPSMFISTAIAMIFTQLAGYVAVFTDGVITSRVLGHEAYLAISLFSHFINIIAVTIHANSVAYQVVSSQAVGRGERDKANSAFIVAVTVNSVAALFFVLISVFRPSDMFRIVCGITPTTPSPEIYSHMLDYVNGFVFGITFFMMTHVVIPIVVMDGGKSSVSLSALVLVVTDIAGDFLNAYVLHGGAYGMGIATSLSYILQFAVIMSHFIGRLHTSDYHSAAIAAQSIQNDLFNLLFCISIGTGKTLLSMTSMLFGAEDRAGVWSYRRSVIHRS